MKFFILSKNLRRNGSTANDSKYQNLACFNQTGKNALLRECERLSDLFLQREHTKEA